MKEEKAKELSDDLKDTGECKPTVETIDIKLGCFASKARDQGRVDIRLKVKNGKLEIAVIRLGERTIITFDVMCLHR